MSKKLSQLNQKASLAAWKFIQKTQKGQTLSEYGVIIGVVVGVVVVAVVIAFRGQITAAFRDATSALRSAR
jgi:Flp pilus assembly pilin Flp